MTKRKILIIEKASELFAVNGFDATSVQDITDACGISKGAFYLSFKSKESLLFSIFEYFSDKLIARMGGIFDLEVGTRERFEQFVSIQFEEIARYSDFILMQIREQTSPGNAEMLGLINELRQKTYEMQEKILLDVYGDKIRKHMPDLLVLLSGLINGYIEIIIFNKDKLNFVELGAFIVDRTDSIVEGLSKPFLKSDQLIGYCLSESTAPINTEELLKDIELLKQIVSDEDSWISLEVIEQELALKDYRKAVIQGMMSNLKNHEETKELLEKLNQLLSSTSS